MKKITKGLENHNPIQQLINKLKIYNVTNHAQLWQWQEGAKDTLNPVPAMLHTLKDIWNDKYTFFGGNWWKTDNPLNITRDTKINFLNKIYNSYLHVLKPLTSKYGIYWRQSDGHGSYGSTIFKVWTLTYYRTHTDWDILNTHKHEWESKKSIFSKHWTTFNHVYNIGDSYGCEDEDVSIDKYHDSLDEQQRLQDEYECEEDYGY